MKRLIAIVSGVVLLAACDPCKGLDCITSDSGVALEFISDSTNTNLFFGDQAIYNPDSLKVTIIMDSAATFSPDTTDGAFFINVYDGRSFVVEYPGVFKDTVQIQTSGRNTECCGYILEYHDIAYDHELYRKQSNYHYIIRK